MNQLFYRSFIELTNRKFLSLFLSKFAKSSASRRLISPFAKFYKVNMDETQQSIHEFSNLHDFFTRQLKIDARPIHQDMNAVVSPVDAVMEDIGLVTPEISLFVKGKHYSLFDMLGSLEKAEKYIGGHYILLYLSPSHYHRIHAPLSGVVVDQWTLGGKSYPVNKYGLKYGKDVLSKNYRKITEVKHDFGTAAIVKVGAMFVNSIEILHEHEKLEKGKEMAYFSFGSTVVLLFERNTFIANSDLQVPLDVKVGEKIGFLKDHSSFT